MWVALGFTLFLAIEQLLHYHHCLRASAGCRRPLTCLVLLGDGLHNFLGGLAIGTTFLLDVRLGIATRLAAAAHEIPQELGDFGVLLHGGWSKGEALVFNVLSAPEVNEPGELGANFVHLLAFVAGIGLLFADPLGEAARVAMPPQCTGVAVPMSGKEGRRIVPYRLAENWRARSIKALLACGLVTGACAARAPVPGDQVEAARHRADAAAGLLTTTLMARLTAALAEGGPGLAVAVCSRVAEDVTRAVGDGKGVILRRTALRTRNPANAPADWERAWLEQAQATMQAGGVPQPSYEVVRSGPGRTELRHLRPIVFPGGLCSRCHGLPEEIPEDVRTVLRERYPTDAATGFRAGDLRGAISVRVPLTAEER